MYNKQIVYTRTRFVSRKKIAKILLYTSRKNHLTKAHDFWQKYLTKGMHVIDATAGNGKDSLLLAKSILTSTSGWLWTIDIQKIALENSKKLLREELSLDLFNRISFLEQSHATFPENLPPINLIVYNLGYLPGGDHAITTKTPTTLQSLKAALLLLTSGGYLSITLYPGHTEGSLEKEAVLLFLRDLPPSYTVAIEAEENPRAPILVFVKKNL